MSTSVFDYDPPSYREWFVNSLRWKSGDVNKPTVFANSPITDVVAISVLEAQVPYTFYTIGIYNNKFYMRERAIGAGAGATSAPYLTCTITPGNYNTGNIGTAVASAIVAGGLVGTYTITFSTISGKLTLASSDKQFDLLTAVPTGLQTEWDEPFNYLPNACCTPLGLEYYNRQNYINVTSLTFPNALSLSGPSWVMLRGNFGIGSADNLVLCDDGTIENLGNVLAAIPVNTVPGSTISWRNNAPRGGFFAVSSSVLDSATFWCTSGDDDTQLDFNGQPFQFKLGILVRGKGTSGIGPGRGITSSGYRR
jgi:hypothetical protein